MAIHGLIALEKQTEFFRKLGRDEHVIATAVELFNKTGNPFFAQVVQDGSPIPMTRDVLARALPFYWESNTMGLVMAAAEKLPEERSIAAEDLVADFGFAWFPGPYIELRNPSTGREGDLMSITESSFCWARKKDELWLVSFMDVSVKLDGIARVMEYPIPLCVNPIKLGENVHDVSEIAACTYSSSEEAARFAREMDRDPFDMEMIAYDLYTKRSRFQFAALIFAGQKVLKVSEPRMAPRGMRKRGEVISNDYRVVSLRAHHYEQRRDQAGGGPIDWSCRWLVRGHWRNQFYPASDDHRTIWIEPHVKGPDDKPMKSSKVVYHINR